MAAKLTPTQQRMLALLSDGRPHARQELHALLCDDLGRLSNIQPHLSHIRKAIRPKGHAIVCEIVEQRQVYYRRANLRQYRRKKS